MNHWKIRTKMFAGFSVVVIVLMGLGLYTQMQVNAIYASVVGITEDALPGVYLISQLKILTQERLELTQSHVNSTNASQMVRLEADNSRIVDQINKSMSDYALKIRQPKEKELLANLTKVRNAYVVVSEEVWRTSASSTGKRRAQSLVEGQLLDRYKNIIESLDELIQFNRQLGEQGTREVVASIDHASVGLWIGLGIAVVAAFTKMIILTKAVTEPMSEMVIQMEALAGGDIHGQIPAALLERADEYGALARALKNMSSNLRSMVQKIDRGTQKLVAASAEMMASSAEMKSGSQRASDRAQNVAAAAEEMSANVSSVAVGMEQTTTNLASVASATEQMTLTIGEISNNSEKARQITHSARQQAQRITEQMKTLGLAAKEIGKVTETINEISSQTNLLALNATIEAARAGAAGKGFAVVANEIKALAQQTATATDDIRARIEGVQSSTTSGIQEIDRIGHVIHEVSDIVGIIAAAIEEQATSTRNIAQNISEASIGVSDANNRVAESSQVSTEIARDIIAVRQAANEISEGSQSMSAHASGLGELAEELKQSVAQFQV